VLSASEFQLEERLEAETRMDVAEGEEPSAPVTVFETAWEMGYAGISWATRGFLVSPARTAQ
jgi:hypothetical protein